VATRDLTACACGRERGKGRCAGIRTRTGKDLTAPPRDPASPGHLQCEPQAIQRQLAAALGISLGRTNDCVRALIERGWVKVRNFRKRDNKLAYSYLLTPQGIDAKARVAARFLKRKRAEYETLKAEIAALAAEVGDGQREETDSARPRSADL